MTLKIVYILSLVSSLILSTSALKSSKIKSALVNATAYKQVNTMPLRLRPVSVTKVNSIAKLLII